MPTKKKPALHFPTVVGPDGLTPTFACGNHQPPHIAKSIKKMMELSQTNGCRKFHVIVTQPVEMEPPAAPPTFICGNHKPQHVANSMGELMNLRATHDCKAFKAVSAFKLIPE